MGSRLEDFRIWEQYVSLASFPSRFKLEGMSAFDCFGLRGSSALVKVTEWSPASTVKFKVYTVCVRVIRVPETLLNKALMRLGLCWGLYKMLIWMGTEKIT